MKLIREEIENVEVVTEEVDGKKKLHIEGVSYKVKSRIAMDVCIQ